MPARSSSLRPLLLVLALCILLVPGCGTPEKSTGASAAQPQDKATVTVTATPTPAETSAETPAATETPTAAPDESKPRAARPAPVDLSGYDNPGLTTPSGNIGCLFDDYDGPHVRCDRLTMAGVPGGKPADCDFDWGHSVEMAAGNRASLACTSDSVMGQQGETDGTRALPYGDSVRYRGITCTSTRAGLRCSTAGGHGFLFSRATARTR